MIDYEKHTSSVGDVWYECVHCGTRIGNRARHDAWHGRTEGRKTDEYEPSLTIWTQTIRPTHKPPVGLRFHYLAGETFPDAIYLNDLDIPENEWAFKVIKRASGD